MNELKLLLKTLYLLLLDFLENLIITNRVALTEFVIAIGIGGSFLWILISLIIDSDLGPISTSLLYGMIFLSYLEDKRTKWIWDFKRARKFAKNVLEIETKTKGE